MKFFLDGQEWDTDKPVYILGYIIIKTWFPITQDKDLPSCKAYGIVARKEHIADIAISHESGRSWVSNFRLTSKDFYDHLDYKRHIIATSPKKAKEKLERLLQEKYGGNTQ